MACIAYIKKRFTAQTQAVIETAVAIIEEYQSEGYGLTLRQLYYQFVARELIENTVQSYSRLGDIISEARLAGLIDWEAIEDRTRHTHINPHWGAPHEIIADAAKQYAVDLWEGQHYRPEVWVEKEALSGIVAHACNALDVPYLSCRGYTSQSEMWSSAQRLLETLRHGQVPVIIHLGDHDPSGIDMTRDIQDRLTLFTEGRLFNVGRFHLERRALVMDQIKEYAPPPNPAKVTDSRFASYRDKFGDESWELDALPPNVLDTVIRRAILDYCDSAMLGHRKAVRDAGRKELQRLSKQVMAKHKKGH